MKSPAIIKDLLKTRMENRDDLDKFKRRFCKKHKVSFPTNIELLKIYHNFLKNKRNKEYLRDFPKEHIEKIYDVLKTRPVRSLSGIVNVSVLTKPYPCPGGCVYCPNEKGMPKSYLSDEPAAARAKALNFNPYVQTKKRIEILKAEGHPTDKIDLRIIGGTWSFYPRKYQEWFVKRCFDAANWKNSRDLKAAKKSNEKADSRIIGISIETRPDFINAEEITKLRLYGVTKVEIGVQSIYDDVLKLNNRGHNVWQTIEATKLLKNAGFKVSYQMMMNLPGSDNKKDVLMFKELFKKEAFKPDQLKIYPCVVLKESPLYKWYINGKYKPYPEEKLIEAIKEIKKAIPPYVRIERIIRDIPLKKIIKGPATNLRQEIKKKYEKLKCSCIRCREVKDNYDPKEKIFLFRKDYNASGGKEIFLSFENKKRDKIYSLLRLRINFQNSEEPAFKILKNSAIIRELHTYGNVMPILGHETDKKAPQHKGFGKKLIALAENMAKKEFKSKKMSVISGVGVRPYYRKLGYKLENEYMVKKLQHRKNLFLF